MNFAIIGATGNVGRKTIEILEKSKLKIVQLIFSRLRKKQRKKKKNLNLKVKNYKLSLLKTIILRSANNIFAAGSKLAEKWVPTAAKKPLL